MLEIVNNKPVIYKESKIMGKLIFKEINKELAKKICIENHYSHKWASNFGVVNVGVFTNSNPNNCLGVASFGWMMFPRAYKSIASNIERDEILELNRLWVDDCLGKNVETMLLSASWKILRYYGKIRVIQSFADGRLGCGTIYKAASFKYYGCAKTSFLKDINTHEVRFGGMFTKTCSPKTMLLLGKKFCKDELEPFVVNTYRYIYKLDPKVNILLKECPYPEYSKGESLVDKNIIFKQLPSTFGGETRGCSQALFRDYILGKIYKDEEACKVIAIKLLNFYTNDQLDMIFNDQKYNKVLQQKFKNNFIYNELVKFTNWSKLLFEDSIKEVINENVITQVNLW